MLEVKDLEISFKNLEAVRGISFRLDPGEALGIVGESGSGKSSIAQAITRLSSATSIKGSVLFEGEDLLKKTLPEMRKILGKKIGMVFQDPMASLNPTMTIERQIEEGLIYHKVTEPKKRVLELLKKVEIPNPEERLKAYPHQLSGGMRQRVLLAIALACNPNLLIADEPTTALDVTVQAQILELFKKRDPQTSLILISHDLAVIATVCQKILVLHEGKIAEFGEIREVLQNPRHAYTQMLLNARS